jgi:L-threonylcarbamoyladenylate synthase
MTEDIRQAVDVLKKGGVILYPTDTIWGIGCDATREDAVKRVFQIKQREDSKSMLILLDSADKLTRYMFEVPEIAWNILEVTHKPLTIIYPQAQNLAQNLIADDGSIGIRIATDEFCKRLIRTFGKPIVSTSANVSGASWPETFDKIDHYILDSVDYVVKHRQDDAHKGQPSGIIKLGIKGEVKVIRE